VGKTIKQAMEYEKTPVMKPTGKHAKKIIVKDEEMKTTTNFKETYKTAKAAHKAEIKELKREIKTHKLLIKQARTMYRLEKLTNKLNNPISLKQRLINIYYQRVRGLCI